jgi:hypothetical protein
MRPVGQGVQEARVDYGPGYRVYFGLDGTALIVLLLCGDKRTQEGLWPIGGVAPSTGPPGGVRPPFGH